MSSWEAVIGIETHVELLTASKMFCGCAVDVAAEPNTNVCPTCLGLPGALPVPNERAIDGIMAIGLALGCEIAGHSVFHRKNYFYPDLPKNYQISQYDLPLCVGGSFEIETEAGSHRIGITRVHMEEDTGKSLHVGDGGRIHDADHSLLDFNRSGVPLVEIVTEPDLRTSEQARVYATELQQVIRALGVSDARLEEGEMRFDVNVSIRPAGSTELGIRAEIKNLNSIRSLQRSIDFEIARQTAVLARGDSVVQETRHWNEADGRTTPGRSKEEAEDYRYFEEPDLLPLEIDAAWRDRVAAGLPELPAAARTRYRALGADEPVAALLAGSDLGPLFAAAVAAGAEPRLVGNWLTQEVVAWERRRDAPAATSPLDAAALVELAAMVEAGDLSATAAKEVLGAVLDGEGAPASVAAARDLIQVSDESAIGAAVDAVLADHPEILERLRAGDVKPVGFVVGKVMQATGGKADPRLVSDLIRRRAAAG